MGTTQAFFERLAERGYEPLLHNASGTIRWDIRGVGSWFVVVNNGSLMVDSSSGMADCVVSCGSEDFERMVMGNQNPFTLYLQGRVNATGDVGLLQLFQRLFPDETLSGSS